MDWNDVGTALAGIAPGLANMVLPGAGIPIAALERALGVDPGTFLGNPAAAAAAVQAATPEQQLALRQAENQLVMAQMANGLATMQAQLADVAGARARDVTLAQAGKQSDRPNVMLAGAYLAVIAIAVLLATGKVGEATSLCGFLITVGTMFANKIATAFDYEFGSSRGSEQKTSIIGQLGLSPTPRPLPDGAKVIDTLPWLKGARAG